MRWAHTEKSLDVSVDRDSQTFHFRLARRPIIWRGLIQSRVDAGGASLNVLRGSAATCRPTQRHLLLWLYQYHLVMQPQCYAVFPTIGFSLQTKTTYTYRLASGIIIVVPLDMEGQIKCIMGYSMLCSSVYQYTANIT